MTTLQEKLADKNKKIDLRINDIWAKAEKNLNELKDDFNQQKEKD